MREIKRISCPGCGREYTVALYDFQYIHCHECQTNFGKHDGKVIPKLLPKHGRRDDEVKP